MLAYRPVGIPRATLVAATLCVVVLELVTPITLRQVYNSFIPNQALGSLQVMMAVAVGALGADVFLRFARAGLMSRLGASFAHRAGCHLMGALLDGRIPAANGQSLAAKLSLLNLVRGYRETGSGMKAITLAEMVLVPLNMALIAMIAGQLVLVSFLLVAGFILYTSHLGRRLLAAREARQKSDADRLDLMVEMLGAVSTIKAMSNERVMTERYSHRKYESALENLSVARGQSLIFDLTSTFSTMLILAVILYGAYMTASSQITLGSMVAAIILAGRTMPPLQRAIAMLNRRQEDQLEERKVQAVLSIAPGPDRLPPADCPPNEGRIAVDALAVVPADGSGQGDAGPADVTMDFPALETSLIRSDDHGQMNAFFRTLAGLQPPGRGRVLLNGTPIELLPEETRSAQVGYLQPDTVLYRGSIMDNLTRFGQVAVSDVMFIARHLALDQDLQVLSRGYDTVLRGDGADPVPPGLRQRIALARALAPRPRVVLFNHADTGLDRRSFTALFELLAKLRGRATVILATNDANLRGLASHVISLDQGGMVRTAASGAPGIEVSKYRELRI